MAYTAIGLREKKDLSLSQQSSEQITQRFAQYENNSYKANFLIRDTDFVRIVQFLFLFFLQSVIIEKLCN